MTVLKLKLTAEIRYLIQEAIRLEFTLKSLADNNAYQQRLKQELQYHHQELGQHLVWAFQEQQ